MHEKLKETSMMIWISSMVTVQSFIMDVRRLCLENFGISVVAEALQTILTYVRYLTYWFEATEKAVNLRWAKSLVVKWWGKKGIWISTSTKAHAKLLLIQSQLFYYASTITTIDLAGRKADNKK